MSVTTSIASQPTKIHPSFTAVTSPKGGHGNNILKELGRFEEALISFDEAIRLAPSYPEGYNNKGNTLQDLHLYEESLIWYDKALTLNPEYVEAYCNKGNALYKLNRNSEACQEWKKAVSFGYSAANLSIRNFCR